MTDPVSATVIAIASTVLTTVGQVKQSAATEAQAKYQMQVANNNKILTERYARDAEARGQAAVQRQQIQTKQLRGRQRAALAANGVQLDEGSALDITSDTLMIGELDALTIRSNAAREALGFRQQGMNFQNQAQMYKYQANNAYDWMAIGGTLL